MSEDPAATSSPRRGIISLGDLLMALDTIDSADPEVVKIIARVLGFTGVNANPAEHTRGISDSHPSTTRDTPPRSAPPPPPRLLPEIPPPPPTLPEAVFSTTLSKLEPVASDSPPPDWLQEPLSDTSTARSPRRAPLFPARTAPGVVGAAVATRRPGERPDMQALIQLLARGEPPAEFPMLAESSVHRGVQVLLDTAESMVPFLADLDDLVAVIARVVGHHNYQLFDFAGKPLQATRYTATLEPLAWRPEPGRPIVAATDFGAGAAPGAVDRASRRDWLDFLSRCGKARCPVVAFVPYGRAHWPRYLSRRITLVHWHHRTRASHVRRLLGAGLGPPG